MKVTIDIDCTPEEARTFLGLPDVQPLQEAMLKEMEVKMKASLEKMDPETFMKSWLPMSLDGFEQIQKAFWGQFTNSKD